MNNSSASFSNEQYQQWSVESKSSPLFQENIELGGKTVEVFALPEYDQIPGRYIYSGSGATRAVGKNDQSLSNFLESKSPLALPYKNFRFCSFSTRKFNKPIVGYPPSMIIDYWVYWAGKKSAQACEILSDLKKLSSASKYIPMQEYSGIQFCFPQTKAKSVKRMESVVRDRLALKEKGKTEVLTLAGLIDVLTPTEVIEVKPAKSWKAALGQVTAYGFFYPAHRKRIHLMGCASPELKQMIETVCSANMIIVSWED